MAKLYFYYSTMNAGKSTALLQAAHNYRERGMRNDTMLDLEHSRHHDDGDHQIATMSQFQKSRSCSRSMRTGL